MLDLSFTSFPRDTRPNTITDQRRGQIGTLSVPEQPRPEVIVLARVERFVVVESMLTQRMAAKHHCRVNKRVGQQAGPSDGQVIFRLPLDGKRFSGFVHEQTRSSQDRHFRMFFHEMYLLFQSSWQRAIVGVQPGNIFSTSQLDTALQRARQSLV